MENFLREDYSLRSSIIFDRMLIYVLAQINGKFPHGFSEK